MKVVMAALVALGLIAPQPRLVIEELDPGGNIGTYVTWWDRVAASGVEVAIEGACVSACVIFTGRVPADRVCVNENAVLGVHMASGPNDKGEMVPDPESTMLMITTLYPKWLQDWIKVNAPNGELQADIIYIKYEELIKHYKHC